MRIPGPMELVRLADQGYRAAEQVIGLVPRVMDLLDRTEQLMKRADALVRSAEQVLRRASGTVERAEVLSADAAALLEPFRPTLQRLEQIAARIAETTSPAEVDAVVQVVDMLPDLVGSLREDVLPILHTLDTVAPDLRQLLIVSHELNEILSSIPGLGHAKQRVGHDLSIPEPLQRPDESGAGTDASPGR